MKLIILDLSPTINIKINLLSLDFIPIGNFIEIQKLSILLQFEHMAYNYNLLSSTIK